MDVSFCTSTTLPDSSNRPCDRAAPSPLIKGYRPGCLWGCHGCLGCGGISRNSWDGAQSRRNGLLPSAGESSRSGGSQLSKGHLTLLRCPLDLAEAAVASLERVFKPKETRLGQANLLENWVHDGGLRFRINAVVVHAGIPRSVLFVRCIEVPRTFKEISCESNEGRAEGRYIHLTYCRAG